MGLITAGMGAVLKHIKKPGKAFTRAGDKWYKKQIKLQRSKKKIDRIRGGARIIVPMTGAGVVGAKLGITDAQEAKRKRGVYGVGRKAIGPKSLIKDIKAAGKKIKKKFRKK